MAKKGSEFYDDSKVFETYTNLRKRDENANDTIEKPIIEELVGTTQGLDILDLGCGDARFGLEAIANGCNRYIGIEPSHNMAAVARTMLASTIGEIYRSTMEEWTYPPVSFDLVISRLALHYVEDIDDVFRRVYQSLRDNGRIIFSVEHPVITSSYKSYESTRPHHDWTVDDYFRNGKREQAWLGGKVIKYHRTIEDYFTALQHVGFVVESLRESRPIRENFINEETYERRMRIPLFLFFAGRKSV